MTSDRLGEKIEWLKGLLGFADPLEPHVFVGFNLPLKLLVILDVIVAVVFVVLVVIKFA